MPALRSRPARILVALVAAALSAALLSSCADSACGSDLTVDLKDDGPGDYVFEGVTRTWPVTQPFRCTYAVRENESGVRVATADECEGRVGLLVGGNAGDGDQVFADFWGAPDEIEWTLSWTLPNALSESPNQLSGTLDPAYEGEEGCSHAQETIE